ncbi:MAG: hypothetical protein WCF92_01290 [bacterium]
MDDFDEFSHLSFTDRLSLILDDDLEGPLDDVEFYPLEISEDEKRRLKMIGETQDLILSRLIKMHTLAQQSWATTKELRQEGECVPSQLEVLVLKSLIFLRIVDLFPKQEISAEDPFFFENNPESLVIFMSPKVTPQLKLLPPS